MVQIIKKKLWPIALVLAVVLITSLAAVGFAVEGSAPTITASTPTQDATITSTRTTVSFTVTDPDLINGSGFFIKANGVTVNSSIQFKGHWEEGYDSCGSSYSYWVVDSYQEATISAALVNLKDGIQNIEVQAKDRLGNIVTKTWAFKVAVPPVFANMTPAGNGWQSATPTVSVKVTDPNGQIDPTSIRLAIDSPVNLAAYSFNASTGTVSCAIPSPGLSDGVHTAYIWATDTSGNEATKSWTFNVHALGPQIVFGNADKTYNVFNPTIEVAVSDAVNVSDQGYEMYIDGQKVTPTFAYNTYWVDDWELEESYVVTDTTKAFIRFTAKLDDGQHTIAVKAKDVLGNYGEQTWKFNVAQPPVLSEFRPANGSRVNGVDTVSAKAYDPNGPQYDFSKISLLVDGQQVVHKNVYNADGSINVTYTNTGLADDGNHSVSVTVADTFGNTVSNSWNFFDGCTGQTGQFSNFLPAETALTKPNPVFKVHFSNTADAVYNVGGATVSIDGVTQSVRPTVTGVAPEYVLTYQPTNLSDGTHTITFAVPGISGAATISRTITVTSPPGVSRVLPVNTITKSTTPVSVRVYDNNGIAKVAFSIDGNAPIITTKSNAKPVPYEPVIKEPTFEITSPNLSDGTHSVVAVVYDITGFITETSWSFKVDTNTGIPAVDMPIIGYDATCIKCHQSAAPINTGSSVGRHPDVPSCDGCHTQKVYSVASFQNCTYCHYQGPSFSYRHTADGYVSGWQDIQYIRHPINDVHLSSTNGCEKCHSRILTQEHARPGRLDRNGNSINCDTCHTGNGLGQTIETPLKIAPSPAYVSSGTMEWAAPAGTTVQQVYIDDNLYHGQTVVVYQDSGSGWSTIDYESQSALNRTPGGKIIQKWVTLKIPAKKIKIYSYGTIQDGVAAGLPPLPDWYAAVPKVILAPTTAKYQDISNAITQKDTSCSACHKNTDHESVHQDELDDKCQTCHAASLTTEHLNNKTTAGKNYSCDTCHSATGKEVKRTIAAESVNCAGCHKQGHNMWFVDKAPKDIPLYTGYQWATPIEASIFTGEPSTPAGYESGQVQISSRLADVKAADIWSFYNSNLTSNGWTLKSPAPAPDAALFTAVFAKNNREVTVKCYNTAYSNGTGGVLPAGYKIELWYK